MRRRLPARAANRTRPSSAEAVTPSLEEIGGQRSPIPQPLYVASMFLYPPPTKGLNGRVGDGGTEWGDTEFCATLHLPQTEVPLFVADLSLILPLIVAEMSLIFRCYSAVLCRCFGAKNDLFSIGYSSPGGDEKSCGGFATPGALPRRAGGGAFGPRGAAACEMGYATFW